MSGKKVIVFRLRKQADMRKCHLFEIETKYDSGTHQEEEEEEQRLHDLRQLDLNFLPSSSMLSKLSTFSSSTLLSVAGLSSSELEHDLRILDLNFLDTNLATTSCLPLLAIFPLSGMIFLI